MPPSAASRRSPLVVLFLTVFIDLMGFGIVIPLLPIYAERMQASAATAGSLIGVYSLMQLVFAPVWGAISDRVGRRPVLLVSLSASAVSYLLLAGAWSIPMLFVARILAGVAGANISVAQAYIADVTSGADRARGMGLIGAAFGLGMVVGPAVGAGLALLGPRVPECFAAGLCLANVLIAAYRLPESLPAGARERAGFAHPLSPVALRDAIARPGAAALLAVFFFVTLGFAVLEGNFSYAAHGYGYTASEVGMLWLYMGAVAVVVQGWLVGRLARRLPEPALVLVGTLALVVGFVWIPYAGALVRLLGALGLVIAGQGLASPSLSSLISKTSAAHAQGEALGVAQSLSAGARFVGPSAGGVILDRFNVRAVFLAAAACAAIALAVTAAGTRASAETAPDLIRVRRSR